VDAFKELEELAATGQHIELIQRKIDQLLAARLDAWEQVLTRVDQLYGSGGLTAAELHRLGRDMGLSFGTGFTKVWDRVVRVPVKMLQHAEARERQAVVDALPSWSGAFPVDYDEPRPGPGVAVAYVLFDAEGVPAYIGSTDHFLTRMGWHRRERPTAFARWIAYRCADREAAYELEAKLHEQKLPYLNKKVGR
jgi:hypothetical protein